MDRLGIFVGFASFFIMEKTLRVLGGEEEGAGHSHSHSHSHSTGEPSHANGHSTAVSASQNANGLKSRGGEKTEAQQANGNGAFKENENAAAQTSKLSAYLNLFGDFVHNITDGLAYVSFTESWPRRFYSSPLIGATTTLACFAHEIPHEIADYSILVRSGFTKKQAMQSQFLTAIGAFVRDIFILCCTTVAVCGTAAPSWVGYGCASSALSLHPPLTSRFS
ncbi:hypothetical protein NUW54_g14642 [Trametes sanguinea]|uniref:Uncharacterized protein n=1 Tax=Trametes sanguinea TaxID=158606 RepID=A0ACC1MAZ9_9APHY|nr:hypothetical protein NUW54_g14642 [Trametes sanguinea]